MSEWRPYRLALLATSPALAGEAKRAGWAYTKSPARRGKLICRRRKASPVSTGEGDREAVEGAPWAIFGFLP